ncbi:MAG: DUF126 domain-containing protein [Proteobacteria bacterium]|nr:DUF126 domain-containing protein [Pseudomonadota bacterium]
MNTDRIKGRVIMNGDVEAESLVSREPISLSYIDENGFIVDRTHHLNGQVIKNKILVFPALKGSAYQELNAADLARNGLAPKGMIALDADTRLLTSALFSEIPTMDQLEADPLEAINTGDIVRLNADEGFIEIKKRNNEHIESGDS